jgi:hypothetical protein
MSCMRMHYLRHDPEAQLRRTSLLCDTMRLHSILRQRLFYLPNLTTAKNGRTGHARQPQNTVFSQGMLAVSDFHLRSKTVEAEHLDTVHPLSRDRLEEVRLKAAKV